VLERNSNILAKSVLAPRLPLTRHTKTRRGEKIALSAPTQRDVNILPRRDLRSEHPFPRPRIVRQKQQTQGVVAN
jgi:hypothetical protein